ncbi:uncharacterized protein [Anoplolepis gracilipes]|uniref:uncharacterized protein isoform X2 n=1 Tax=Anoplolepis gracilipes TaxID=354296 RepID=UPI003BA352B6
MDHRQKMVVVPQQSKNKIEDDDDEDVEALRLAALKSLRTKDATHKRSLQKVFPQVTQPSRLPYKGQRPIKRNFYHNRSQQRQNGNVYYQSPRNPNLIAIVPVDEPSPIQQTQLASVDETKNVEKTEPRIEPQEISKFHRFKDSGSASEEEDTKEQKSNITFVKTEIIAKEEKEESLIEENQEEVTESSQKNGNNQEKEDGNDDDDDVLLMADLEEEDSLERLMDEMEREMNDVNKPSEKKEKKLNKGEIKGIMKGDEGDKNFDQKMKSDENCGKKERNSTTTSALTAIVKNDRRSVSPYITNRVGQKRKSLSPRSRSRKKSPRRSPRKSPIRQPKRSPRESVRYRSPRKSPSSRYSPRPRSPRLSPRRSPNRTSTKRSPLRKLSPRGRSPKLSSRSRSPRPHRSRSPRRSKSPRLRSPKISRSRSPRLSRSRSPRYSPPLRLSRSKSPRLSPRRVSPRRLRSRSRSPGLSPLRRGSPRLRSPKVSPRRTSPRLRSPRLSPHRSPWSSPRHSPRLSPRRRRSPKWSPKELPRKHGPRSITPDINRDQYVRDSPPIFKSTASPEIPRMRAKQKDEAYERSTATIETVKESVDTISDPVLEARRKKFESTRPIDPVNANKKIKLSKKHTTNTKVESSEGTEIPLGSRKATKTIEEFDVQEIDCLADYEFEEFEETVENTSPTIITSSINTCIDVEQKPEKEKSLKKKKKRDKELYQVGKLKSELPLSERIGKDKKCKKRKEMVSEESMDSIFEDIAVDEEGDLRAELSRRRAERLNRTVPIQSARLVQSAFKGVVNEVVKNNQKVNQRHVLNTDDKSNQKEVRRVTVLHRSLTELHGSEDESTLDSKVPVRFRLGLNKQVQESRESKVTRKASKRQGRKE